MLTLKARAEERLGGFITELRPPSNRVARLVDLIEGSGPSTRRGQENLRETGRVAVDAISQALPVLGSPQGRSAAPQPGPPELHACNSRRRCGPAYYQALTVENVTVEGQAIHGNEVILGPPYELHFHIPLRTRRPRHCLTNRLPSRIFSVGNQLWPPFSDSAHGQPWLRRLAETGEPRCRQPIGPPDRDAAARTCGRDELGALRIRNQCEPAHSDHLVVSPIWQRSD